MAAITGLIAAASLLGSAIVGNQQKQKAKGQAAAVQREAQAANDAADAKLKAEHDQNIRAQSQAAGVERAALEAQSARSPTLISPDLSPSSTAKVSASTATPLPTPLAPVQRKTLLGQ